MRTTRGAGSLRRYPALGLILAAAALAMFLPSALNLPQSQPSSLAEFAPVPGTGGAGADVSTFGQAESTGPGKDGAVVPEQARAAAPQQKRPRLKRCVGNPSRQVEDPLSPPCVAFFDGDNGGATARGVTGDEVTVIYDVGGNQTTDPDYQKVIDCHKLDPSDQNVKNQSCTAYMRYFNERYQTYGRFVHLYASHAAPSLDVDKEYRPFAGVRWTSTASRSTLAVSYNSLLRRRYQEAAPYLVTFRADLEDQARIVASFACLKLAGLRAQYSNDPTFASEVRKFGLIHNSADGFDLVVSEMKDQCGLRVTVLRASTAQEIATGLAGFRTDRITTVIPMLDRIPLILATNTATQQGYFPEWFIVGSKDYNGPDTNHGSRAANPTQWASAFGVMFDYRRDAMADQPWARAYREGCPSCPDPVAGSGDSPIGEFYEQLALLFYGIQAAGPRLSAQNIDKGLHAIPPLASADPYRPAAYFAPGNYAWLKDATAVWWDPSGTPPGGRSTGCLRLVSNGKRFRASEWTRGDGDIRGSGPCQGDIRPD